MPVNQKQLTKAVAQPVAQPGAKPVSTGVVELCESNCRFAANAGPYCREKLLMNRNDVWHKFSIVGGIKFYRNFVLNLIIEAAFPFQLIPVKYEKDEPNTFFYARNCGGAIEKLCRSGLVIPNTHGENIQLRVFLAFTSLQEVQVNIKNTIVRVLGKRYNRRKKSLNLNDFHNDSEFSDVLFCPLSQPKILKLVLTLSLPKPGSPISSIFLANNELVTLKSLEVLWNNKELKNINLSQNKIESIEELVVLKPIPLEELVLDNNPLCQRFTDEAYYIFRVRDYAPAVKRLDGIFLSNPGIPQPRRNFLVTPKAGPLADQFTEHYFNLYDGDERRKLYGMYHDNATISMTATYIPGQSTSSTARLTQYMIDSRNLLKVSDFSKTHPLLYRGQEGILSLLCRLPRTEHDPYSFSVDVAVYTGSTVVLNVTGVFRETNNLIRAFSRVFVLVCILPNEWQICNEMLNVSNARTDVAARSFMIQRPPIVQRVSQITDRDKEEMTELLMNLTDMKNHWSAKCLEDTQWDFKEAVTIFTKLYKQGKIPAEAFQPKKK